MYQKATVAVVYENKSGEGSKPLKIRVTFNRSPRTYPTGSTLKLTKEEWKRQGTKKVKDALADVEIARMKACKIVDDMGADFTFEEFSERYNRDVFGKYNTQLDMQYIFDSYVEDKSRSRTLSQGSITDYQTAVNWVLDYKPRARIQDITKEFVNRLEAHIRARKPDVRENTLRLYYRELKALYNYAVSKEWIKDNKPFGNRSLQCTRRKNIGLSVETVQKIKEYQSDDKLAMLGRDFFLLSCELNGNYISDALSLKNRNLSNGNILTFTRRKTRKAGIEIKIELTEQALELLRKYGKIDPNKPDEYILPILAGAKDPKQEDNRIHDFIRKVNDGLAIVCEQQGIPIVKSGQARHTYASLVCENGRSIYEIQADLGHGNVLTTQGYLNSISTESIERAKQLKERLF